MRPIGTITQLQIQRSSLKTGEKPNRTYDPAPILSVQRLTIGPDGVFGLGPDDAWIVDVHHRAHPESKNPAGENGVSIGFTAHYQAMQQRFGSRVFLGCAGENIIVETDRSFTLDDLQNGIAILSGRDQHAELMRLATLDVAHPCRPFTGWALGRRVEADALKAHLQFLENGTRGFLLATERTAIVSVGDTVALA